MIDIKILRENPKDIETAARNKGITINAAHILEIDEKYRELSSVVQLLREERNQLVKAGSSTLESERNSAIAEGKKLKVLLEQKEHALNSVKDELDRALLTIPNPAKSDVKIGKDETENEVIRSVGEPTKFAFPPKDHLELGEALGIIDVQTASQVSGSRFNYLKNEAVLLESALKELAFEVLLTEGFIPVTPPVLIKHEVMDALGYTAMGEADNIFSLDKDGLYLVGTSEQSIVPIHMNATLKKKICHDVMSGTQPVFAVKRGVTGKIQKEFFVFISLIKLRWSHLLRKG